MNKLLALYKKCVPAQIQARIRGQVFPMDELHIERIEETGNRVLQYLRRYPETRACVLIRCKTPSIKEIEYYTRIQDLGNPLALHVHFNERLAPLPSVVAMEYQLLCVKQLYKHIFNQAPTHIVPGQWNVNHDFILTSFSLGMTHLHLYHKCVPHISQKYGILPGVSVVPVYHYVHDYQL